MCFVRDDSFNMERGYCELLVLLLINMIDNVLQHVHCAKNTSSFTTLGYCISKMYSITLVALNLVGQKR